MTEKEKQVMEDIKDIYIREEEIRKALEKPTMLKILYQKKESAWNDSRRAKTLMDSYINQGTIMAYNDLIALIEGGVIDELK